MVIDILLFMVAAVLAVPAICGYYAFTRGRSFWLWFFIGCILPVFSYFILIMLPDKTDPADTDLEQMRIDLGILGTVSDVPIADPLYYRIKNAPVSKIEFLRVDSSWRNRKVLDILINGDSLTSKIQKVELPYAKTSQLMAGAYEGVGVSFLDAREYFLGTSEGEPKIVLESSKPNNPDWNIGVDIRVYRRIVVWHNFQQTAMNGYWRYDQMGLLVFDKLQYFDAIYAMVEEAKKL